MESAEEHDVDYKDGEYHVCVSSAKNTRNIYLGTFISTSARLLACLNTESVNATSQFLNPKQFMTGLRNSCRDALHRTHTVRQYL